MDAKTHSERLRARLVAHKGKFREIAHLGGISYSYITKFAQGARANPTVETIDRLRRALDSFERQRAA